MNVWILQTGEPLHCDPGSPRPMRAMNLANALVSSGHRVVLWSSDFYHQEKRHRFGEYKIIRFSELLEIRLIPSPGYKKNIGIGRLWDHFILAKNLYFQLNKEVAVPDIGFIGYPPIECAAVMTRWLKKRNIASVIDVKDQWPSIFLDPVPRILKPLFSFLLAPYFYYGRRALKDSTVFSSMSQSFLTWMMQMANSPLNKKTIIFPLVAPLTVITEDELDASRKWWSQQGVHLGDMRRFCFIGSLSPAFDFKMIRDVAYAFQSMGIVCQFVICGDGGSANDIKELMKGLDNVIFPGWVDRAKAHALAKSSLASLAPYKNIANFTDNIPNKIIDSFSHGIPVISSLSGEVKALLESEGVGFYVDTSQEMEQVMLSLLKDNEVATEFSRRAMALYFRKYSYEDVYKKAVMLFQGIVDQNKMHGVKD